uniref:5-fold beta-flower protein n=1 Tax=Candidatus Scatocola faecigallinarum TaxID=2840916 RepID=UPI004027A2EA
MNKIRSGVRTLAFFSVLFFAAPAAAIEITAIDFNGDLIGKVIPDGKVVSLDNQLIGNVTADSLIVNFDGELIGGVIPQGIAIGNDNKLLGKVSNDGSVRLASGKIVGKVLPNGLVVDDYFNVLGAVLFPGLIYSDDGKTVGRLTGDGLYTNLQGQQIGFVSPDGYAYRKVGNDYLLDGRLISSKMVISLDGAFIGSVSPGGNVTDFEAQTIGFVKANGYVYNENNQIIGQIVRSGFAFDNNGKYIGFVTYNGEVVNKDDLVGRMRADGRIADAKGEIIGFAVDLAATATDLEGRYLGRIMPGGSLAQAREVVGQVGPRGTVINKDGKIIGRLVNAGPVFNFRGALRAHALKSGAVISLEGTPLGNVRANLAYDNNGLVFGATLNNELVIAPGGKSLGMSGINASVMDGSERKFVSPFGFLFSSDGVLSGSTMTLAPVYNLTGAVIAYMMPNGSMYNKGVVALGRLTEAGINIDERNRILGRNIAADYAFSAAGELLGILSETNMVLDKGLKPKAKILPDNSVVKAGKNTEVNFNPQVGTASDQHLVLGVTGSLFGYADIDGAVRNPAGRVAGKVVDGGLVIDNSGLPVGETSGYKAVVDGDCALLGVVTPQGDIRNYRETFIGRMLWNGQAVSETGAVIGYQVIPGSVIDFNGNIQGTISPSGQVMAYGGELLGCIDKRGKLRNADGEIIGGQTEFYPVMNVNGVFIGRTVLDGTVVNEANEFIGYMQPNDNVNSKTGVPVGQLFKYRFAFDNDNNFLGRVGSDARVFNAKNEEVGKVEFGGAVLKDGKNIGYALYDMYVYDNDANVIGYITRDGNVLTVNGRKLGRIDKGFLINGENKVAGRGNRDFYIRNQNNVVLGELELNGSLVDPANHVIGSLKDNGRILDSNGNVLAIAKPLQYYSLLKELTEAEAARLAAEKAEAERLAAEQAAAAGNYVIGDDGYLRDANGNIIGRILPDGTVVDLNGNVIGHINENGEFVGLDGKVKGKTSKDGYVVGDDGYLRDANGNIIGRVLPDGTVVDLNGNVIGHINENGEFVGLDGKVMGKVNGGGADWYSKPVQIGAIPEIGVVGEEEMKKYRKSLGIALTPDGEYLGDIMDDGSVVDKKGNVVGKKMPDGLIIDDDGTLIGIEEVKKPDSSGMFVPAGTFGPGGAYGTGMGAGGNLGPGGGFGPGERYDPQRAAALAAAQNQRRQAMSVGKISSGIRPESFDGYQKNWDEQGIAKAVSSWRVNLSEMIFADKPIPAVIARSIDSNNPTPVTAFVERNVYAEEGRNVVIPAGSRLMGTLGGLTAGTETTSSSAKVQITWERLIRPDGSLFVFQGITGDAQGRGGALGYLDQQLFKKYTLPIMTTALTSYTSYIMAPKDDDDNSSDTESPRQQAANDARQNFLQDMNRIFEQILADKTNIKPLTYVPAGTRIIVYPNIDLWLRTPERDEAEVAKNLSKRDVLIDDNKLEQDRTDTQNRRKMGMTDADRAATAGSVVYEAEGTDAEAVAAPRLMDDSKVKSKKPAATAGAPALMPTTPAGGSTPPPPPSFSSGSSSSSSSSSSSAAKTDNSVPQLF